MINRRDFLKITAGLFVPLLTKPVVSLIPPRKPFVHPSDRNRGLAGLYSHLGVLPSTRELNICEGIILEIEDWDGTGYPCLVQNVCTTGNIRAFIYDFDLYNFRDYQDEAHRLRFEQSGINGGCGGCTSRTICLSHRFGDDAEIVVKTGGG